MKNNVLTALLLMLGSGISAQSLTLVTGKRLYEHHSSSLSSQPYGNADVNTQSGYDFVTHAYVASGAPSLAPNRDMVEHNGYFGINGNSYGWKFGFTSNVSNIGGMNYAGNNTTSYYLTNVPFSSLNTVQDLISAYNSSAAKKFDTAVVAGNIYVAKLRNSDTYIAMRIVSVQNLTQAEVIALDNSQSVTADVFFDFEYKYGTLCTPPTVTLSTNQATICSGQSVTLTAIGASSYTWSQGGSTSTVAVKPSNTTTYVVTGSNGTCAATASIVQSVKVCTDMSESFVNEQFRIFPNPATSVIFIEATAGSNAVIRNALGEVMIDAEFGIETKVEMDVRQLSPGLYTMSFYSKNGMLLETKKLIKN